MNARRTGVYFVMRLRIGLRKEGKIPLVDKLAHDELIKEAAPREKELNIKIGDIRRALYEGHEVRNDLLRGNG